MIIDNVALALLSCRQRSILAVLNPSVVSYVTCNQDFTHIFGQNTMLGSNDHIIWWSLNLQANLLAPGGYGKGQINLTQANSW